MNATPLRPIIRSTPGQGRHLPPAVRVSYQQRAARDACRECARSFRIEIDELPRDADGAPLPVDGWYWSISHTSQWVAAILYPYPVGIDVERVHHRRQELVRAATSHDELELLGGFRWQNFARIWSAKEAVLKKALCGLSELSQCRLMAVPGPLGLVLHHRGRPHFVHQIYRRGHYASLCAEEADCAEIRWDWQDEPAGGEDL